MAIEPSITMCNIVIQKNVFRVSKMYVSSYFINTISSMASPSI